MIHKESLDTPVPASSFPVRVDVIMPVYNEQSEALEATLDALLRQTYPIARIFVIDDCSLRPISVPPRIQSTGKVSVKRLLQNQKIAAARNAGIALSTAPLLACVNCEVLPDADWLATCVGYLLAHPGVGVCYTRTEPYRPNRLLSRWRMRFQETKFGDVSGQAHFAPGHAVLFQREAVEKVNRYNVLLGNSHEDSDICERIRLAGWETHYVSCSRCVSIQDDTIIALAKKELSRNYWDSPSIYTLPKLVASTSMWFVFRMGRNLVKGRILFLPIDVAVWATAIRIAISKTFR